MKKRTKMFVGLLIVILAVVAGASYIVLTPLAEINSFDDCVDAGFPVMESYPRQCMTSDGRGFVENITMNITT